ncbi:MAG: HAD family hydrolase [bacterium]|nr:HAD family hydrolase [Candidatus Colisoma equi]
MSDPSRSYVLWDWNGTLLDDTQAALDTLNIMLAKRGVKPIALEFFREHFAFPCRPFYDMIGMHVEDDEWDALAQEYHDIYAEQPKRLNRETIAALERVKRSGAKQSIISALRQDLLDEVTARMGVADYMECIYGVDNLDGASKLDRALELMSRIAPSAGEPPDVVLIGDALHDKEVADALKVRCVLCGQGSHAAWRLREVAPTGETLLEAVELALCP